MEFPEPYHSLPIHLWRKQMKTTPHSYATRAVRAWLRERHKPECHPDHERYRPLLAMLAPPEVITVSTCDVNSSVEVSSHHEFTVLQKLRLEAIREAVADAYPISQYDWEEGFRKDAAPEREIALWERVAKFYTYFASKRVPSIEGRQELLSFLFACVESYASGRAAQQQLQYIEPALAETIFGCQLFDSFALDDPKSYPPDEPLGLEFR